MLYSLKGADDVAGSGFAPLQAGSGVATRSQPRNNGLDDIVDIREIA